MKNWLYAMNKIQETCNGTLNSLSNMGASGGTESNSYSMQSTSALNVVSSSLQSQSFMGEGSVPGASPYNTSVREQLAQQRMKIENCRHLVENLEPVFLRVLGRICEEEYTGVDTEFAAAQKPVVQAALQFIVLLQNSCLSDAACGMKTLFDDQWTRNLELAYQALALTPQSLLHVHVRDMR
jgi:hypothetical protein